MHSRHRGFRIPWSPVMNCIVCQRPLPTGRKKLCSAKCRSERVRGSEAWQKAKRKYESTPGGKARKAAREEGAKRPRQCAWCGATWMVRPTRPSQYCTSRCARAAQLPAPACPLPPGHRALRTPLALEPGRSARRTRVSVVPAVAPRSFTCGRCQWCGHSFVAIGRYRRTRCSRSCDRAYWKALRRVQIAEAGSEAVSRVAVFDRDHWLCQLCGTPVDRTAMVPDDHAPTLDHIIPVSLGGPHTMANLRTAHFICNSRRGNEVLADRDGAVLVGQGGKGVSITRVIAQATAAVNSAHAISE
ncbi:HNH endonuclease [Streptomyces stelliscabiei]|uniref:HNH endonuclease n=2 Tax=Streptomyces stelliscabiei TaxID=146820 RepID=UPI0038D448A7